MNVISQMKFIFHELFSLFHQFNAVSHCSMQKNDLTSIMNEGSKELFELFRKIYDNCNMSFPEREFKLFNFLICLN